jgi:uncharacterized membrane protein (DUF4010 family)
LLRVMLALALISPTLAQLAAPYFAVPFLLGGAATALGYRRITRQAGEQPPAPQNPLEFKASIAMAALFQVVFYVMYWIQSAWGDRGVLASGAVLGLTDMDALTLSLARGEAGIPLSLAIQALVIGMISNTVLKTAVCLALGRGSFRRIAAGGLTLIGVGLASSLLLFR